MPPWLSHALEWLGAGGVGLSFLGTLWAYVLVRGRAIVAAKTKRLVAAYEASKVPDSDPPKTPLLTEPDLVRTLRAQLDQQERLHAAEVRGLRAELREVRAELDSVRGDLVVAAQARVKAERAGREIVRQWRRAQGLDSEPPEATTLPPDARKTPRDGFGRG